jgi:hypothetical protein
LWPLLVSAAGEVVAAVWTSPDETVRHYIVPWLPAWTPLLDWLAQRAILEFVPAAARRVRARVGDETELQTAAEASTQAALAQLDEEYRARRGDLKQGLRDALRRLTICATTSCLARAWCSSQPYLER